MVCLNFHSKCVRKPFACLSHSSVLERAEALLGPEMEEASRRLCVEVDIMTFVLRGLVDGYHPRGRISHRDGDYDSCFGRFFGSLG